VVSVAEREPAKTYLFSVKDGVLVGKLQKWRISTVDCSFQLAVTRKRVVSVSSTLSLWVIFLETKKLEK